MVNFTGADRVGVVGGYLGGINALLSPNGLLGGMLGNRGYDCNNNYNHGCNKCGDECDPVSWRELKLVNQGCEKDSIIATLTSQKYTDNKFQDLQNEICELKKHCAVTATHQFDYEKFVNAEFVHQPTANIEDCIVTTKKYGCRCGEKEETK